MQQREYVLNISTHSSSFLEHGLQEDGSTVSVFEFDSSLPRNRNAMPLAKNTLRKLRTIRHPDVLKFLDAVETDSSICIMTERVRPLAPAIQERASKPAQEKEDWLLWGLHRISVCCGFLLSLP